MVLVLEDILLLELAAVVPEAEEENMLALLVVILQEVEKIVSDQV